MCLLSFHPLKSDSLHLRCASTKLIGFGIELALLWTRLQPLFKSLKASVVRPDQQIFHGDDRFTVLLALNRIAITDHAPGITICSFLPRRRGHIHHQ